MSLDLVTVGTRFEHGAELRLQVPRARVALVSSVLSGRYDASRDPVRDAKARRVLDIGAGVGEFAWYAAKRWERCWIDCWEPDPELREVLEAQGPAGMRVIEGCPQDDWRPYDVVRVSDQDMAYLVTAEYGAASTRPGALLIVDFQELR